MAQRKLRSTLLRFDRTLSQDSLRQVLILLIVLAAIFMLSFLLLYLSGDDWIEYCEKQEISKWAFPFYLLVDGNAFNSFYGDNVVGGWATLVGCIIYIAGVVIFTGMIISVMTNMIERRVERFRNGELYYLKSGHYIIMGFGDMVPSFIKYIFEKDPEAYILVFTSHPITEATEKLRKTFGQEQMNKIIFTYGHRTTPESYGEIHLEASEEIFIVGYHGQPAHDAINVECVDSIHNYLKTIHGNQRPKRITCVFRDIDTYAAFKTSEIFEKIRELNIEFVPYNFYASWAKQVLVKRFYKDVENSSSSVIEYPAVFGNGIGPDDKHYVHLVFAGTTNFAVSFAMEAAHVLHFPNFNKDNKLKTRITFIDVNADKEKDEFIIRNRHFFEVQSHRYIDLTLKPGGNIIDCPATYFKGKDADFLDIEFEFIKGDIFSNTVQDQIEKWANDTEGQYLSIFLALKDQRSNFVMGMNMPDAVYDNEVPVFIRQDRSDNFVKNLRMADSKLFGYSTIQDDNSVKTTQRKARYAHIYPFGMNETAYHADSKSMNRAKLINYLYCTADYETNRFKGELELSTISNETIWEDANKLWSNLSVSIMWSNLYNSYTIRTKLATLRAMRGLGLNDKSQDFVPLSEEEAEELAKVEHNRWNVEKLLMGYRKPHYNEDAYNTHYADDKSLLKMNKKLFIHHDIRPFDTLDNIMELDKEFTRSIPWIMKMTETKIQD